ncbi:dipeptide ABC transporter ATP-binding protein [Brevibacterium sp. 5221]|uniref:Dipeptide ABC transporter ATP-binding protein n=1 Tax=Brevibacterium rongguiense TaxID=2695267 RepID=A0A6N9H456_9MICO|nr:ABC transporter ATP-binding protein [Brevibacterium rongguiense]MYM18611.1 dipeptide ABC transporter ATP-binding protein [Brevibacterium rongguiense]
MSRTAPAPVLELSDLTVAYPAAPAPAVDGAALTARPGRTVALVGESGSGKSSLAAAAAGLSVPGARVRAAVHTVGGVDMRGAGQRAWRAVHGSVLGFVPQDAGTGLNPVRSVAGQLAHTLRTRGARRREAAERAAEALAGVGLEPRLHGRRRPHELSGGQRQRILLALALAGEPRLVIADEPTSALDVTVQRQVLDLLAERTARAGAALVLITHDLGVAADRADDVLVMSGGRIVEAGTAAQVLESPREPYTRRLLAAAPGLDAPRLIAAPRGGPAQPQEPPVLRAAGLVRDFAHGGGSVRAVDGVSLELPRGRTLGIVGESGSGKSTTARLLVGLEPADAGEIELLGAPVTGRRAEAVRLARRVRFVHQDPSASLDPRRSAGDSIAEPLAGFGIGTRAERPARVRALLERVALPADAARRRPGELSGGQRQRVAIARALAVDPEVVVLDEPVSALDVSVQAQILELLAGLQRELGLSYVFISHDLAVVRQIAHDVLVMAQGRVVDAGPTEEVFAAPTAPTTRALLAAVPGRAQRPPSAGPATAAGAAPPGAPASGPPAAGRSHLVPSHPDRSPDPSQPPSRTAAQIGAR